MERKRNTYDIDPELGALKNLYPPVYQSLLPAARTVMKPLWLQLYLEPDIELTKYSCISEDGEPVEILELVPDNLHPFAPSPAIVYFHGGGFALNAAPYHYSLAAEYARKAGCKVYFVRYRLSPKYPYPVPVQDALAASRYVIDHADDLHIDPEQIVFAGDSAGAILAMDSALAAAEENWPFKPAGLMLVYPVTDLSMQSESIKKYTDTPMCNTSMMERFRRWYLEGIDINTLEKEGRRDYLSPILSKHLDTLPKTYIETAEFDCLHDDGEMLRQKLQNLNIPLQFYRMPKTIHGYDMALNAGVTKRALQRRTGFLKSVFNHPMPNTGYTGDPEDSNAL